MGDKIDLVKAKEMLGKAEKYFPFDKNVINLKEKLFDLIENISQNEFVDWESFLIKALVKF